MTHPYSSRQYMEALAQGSPLIEFSKDSGFAILRPIDGTPYFDTVGSYPFSALSNYALELPQTISGFQPVSYVTVTDALDDEMLCLKDAFDFSRPYKTHFIYNRALPHGFSKHHRYEVKKANELCNTRPIDLAEYLDEWCHIYDALIQKHKLSALHRFSRAYFNAISKMPAFVTLGAFVGEQLVSAHIWLKHGDFMYSHLAASSKLGYARNASYALYADVIGRFENCKIFDLGGAPDNSLSDGLARFKRGFSNDTRTNWICGQIFDKAIYNKLCSINKMPHNDLYFPAYRDGNRLSDF